MKKYIIDTNALISFITDRNQQQQEIVSPLFEAASRSKCILICHQFALTEFVFVMDKVYGTPKDSINMILHDFIAMPGVQVFHQTDFSVLLSLWPSKITDFGDALLATTGKAIKGSTIVTFDLKFKSEIKMLGINYL